MELTPEQTLYIKTACLWHMEEYGNDKTGIQILKELIEYEKSIIKKEVLILDVSQYLKCIKDLYLLDSPIEEYEYKGNDNHIVYYLDAEKFYIVKENEMKEFHIDFGYSSYFYDLRSNWINYINGEGQEYISIRLKDKVDTINKNVNLTYTLKCVNIPTDFEEYIPDRFTTKVQALVDKWEIILKID